jgi:hypothetical protein
MMGFLENATAVVGRRQLELPGLDPKEFLLRDHASPTRGPFGDDILC